MANSFSHSETNPRLTENTCDEPDASLMPLEDYQHSDLMPLETATESIQPFFRTLPRDVWIAKNASKKPADSLTSDEAAAIHLYTMEIKDQPLYSLLNKLLRDRDRRKLRPWFSYLKLFLTALFKLPVCSAKIVWRGVKADLHSKYHRGETYTWWAFSSCTLSLEVLEQPMYLGTTGERTLFSIECLNGRNIKPHSYYKTEDEILLLPGFYFEVVSKVKAGNGLHIIHLREVVPPFVLLEPPFVDIHPSTSSSVSPISSTIDLILDKVYEMNKDNDDGYKLFVVLPHSSATWNSGNLFANDYVLHFVCECSTDEMHFTCHPTYTIPNPRVFFQIYGNYMKQFMMPLAQHLLEHRVVDKYHDTRFWSEYTSNLDKMARVLDAVEHGSTIATETFDTSQLNKLLMLRFENDYSMCRSITVEMSVRWVCMHHYPAEQLNLIHQLDDVQEVTIDIKQSALSFNDDIDSAKTSRVCNVFAQGLRLYQIDFSELKTSASSLQQLTKTFSRASLMSIDYSAYLENECSDSENLETEARLNLCSEIISSNCRMKHVTTAVYGKYSKTNDQMVNVLKSNRNLRSLRYGLPTNSRGFIQIMSTLEKGQMFTTLKLTNHALPPESEQSIAALIRSSRTLTNLTLSETDILDEGMQIIVDAICASPVMKILSVRSNKLSDESASFITRLLRVCSSLTDLNMALNKITIIGAQLIFEELQTNRTLLHLDIGWNDLSVDHARETTKYNGPIVNVGELISKMLLRNTTLCSLGIKYIKLVDNDVRPLADALTKNCTLAHLASSEDECSSTLSKPITDVLHWKCSLIGLDLSFSDLSEVDIQKLGEILQKNNKLHFLRLYNCSMDDKGIDILCQSLKNNSTLTHLDLASNDLTSAGAAALADMLRVNVNLTYLDISSNKIGDDGVKAIARALSNNSTLTCMNSNGNGLTDTGVQYIVNALKSNNVLLHLCIIFENKISSSTLASLRLIRRNLIVI